VVGIGQNLPAEARRAHPTMVAAAGSRVATGSPAAMAGSPEEATGSREVAVGSREVAARIRVAMAGSPEEATGSREVAVDSPVAVAGIREWVGSRVAGNRAVAEHLGESPEAAVAEAHARTQSGEAAGMWVSGLPVARPGEPDPHPVHPRRPTVPLRGP